MRILFVSAFYPPYVVGGWEQLVQNVGQQLQARGHTIRVLSSTHGVGRPVEENGVSRLLTLESDLYHYQPFDFINHKRRLEQNLLRTEESIRAFNPDVVFVHVMFNLSRGIPWIAEQLMPGRVVYYVANDWPYAPDPHTLYWRDPAKNRVMAAAKRLAAIVPLKVAAQENRRFALKFEHVMCVSQAVKEDLIRHAGITPSALQVVYNGVETDRFAPNGRFPNTGFDLALLYAGSLVPHKGVHTAIEAMALLARQNKLGNVKLTIVGSGHPDYEAGLRTQVAENGLDEHVYFHGRVPREQMPVVLQKFDVLLFPSIWEEPLSRMMQEGMAAGLVVIGTLTGGSGELLVEGETGLTFPPGDAAVLARRIEELSQNRTLLAQLSQNGRVAVVSRFDIQRMIDEIEVCLAQIAAEPASSGYQVNQ